MVLKVTTKVLSTLSFQISRHFNRLHRVKPYAYDREGFAKGYDAVCALLTQILNSTLEILAGFDVKLLLMRCAGTSAVDVNAAKDLGITVTRTCLLPLKAIAERNGSCTLLLAVVFTVVTSEFAK